MKIMYFLDDGQSFGGAANTLIQQAILMKKNGTEVCLVVSNYEYDEMDCGYYDICLDSNIKILRFPFRISSQPEDIDVVCLLDNYSYIRDSIKEYAPDILHSIQINSVVELVSRELGIPHIMNIYPLIPDFFSITYMNVFPHFHLCDSEYYASKWKRYLQTDSKCIKTVVTKRNRKVYSIKSKNELCFVCVGSIYKQKNQLEVIKAFHLALKAGVKGKLLIYGYATDAYAVKCKEYINGNGLQQSVLLKGFVADMFEEYKNADVLICGSTRESYPNVISEALANDLIVISTPVGGVPEVIEDGINGYLCDGYSKESIFKKVVQCYKERQSDKIDVLRKNAYDIFIKEHSEESVTEKLLAYYSYVQCADYDSSSNIQVTEIRKEFESIINLYQGNKASFRKPLYIQKKLWYIWHIRPIIYKLLSENDKKIYIWGTGELAIMVQEILETFFDKVQVSGYLDTYKEGVFCDLKIFHPQEILRQRECLIFIGTFNGQNEIIEMLKGNNKEFNKDYFILTPRRW